MSVLTTDELKEELARAEERADAAEARIQSAGTEIDPEVLGELEAEHDEAIEEIKRTAAAITRAEKRANALKAVPRPSEDDKDKRVGRIGNEPLTYRPKQEGGKHSFYGDMIAYKRGDFAAGARLQRHMKEMEVERRDMTTVATDGGEFTPPAHLQDRWAALARSSRVYADALPNLGAPPAISFTLPKVTTGALTAVTATENSAISEQDAVTANVTFAVTTIAGMVDLSVQSMDFSTPGLDEVISQDLAADYATKLDVQLLNGSGSAGQVQGVFTNSNVEAVTYTDATPTVGELYSKIADAVQRIATLRFMPADAIFMHPRRWGWISAASDSTGRPLVSPVAPQNSPGTFAVTDQGAVGSLQGLPVFLDANIRTTVGAGTNEDEILVTRRSDHIFYETGTPFVRVFDDVGSGTLTVRIRVHGYIAYTSDRYGKASAKINGTGLVAPTF